MPSTSGRPAGELEDEIADLGGSAGAVMRVEHPFDGALDPGRQALLQRRRGGPQLVHMVLSAGEQRAQVGHRRRAVVGDRGGGRHVRRLSTSRARSQLLDPAVELRFGVGHWIRLAFHVAILCDRPDALLPSMVSPSEEVSACLTKMMM